ncbi:MAG: GtrA family protein [Bacteroides sp.]|nr:GtrA family protein [Bacillota bacterium]MCM1393273.1 GtrA family protein [[Eubacterium] siraeum]MCM1455424.1 GtrA family protein [Bacteroides sp.]
MDEITNENDALLEASDEITAAQTGEVPEGEPETTEAEVASEIAENVEAEAPETAKTELENEKGAAEQADECSADIAVASDISVAEATEQTAKKKKPLPPKIQKLADYLNSHEDVRQMVFFLMFSVLCGLSQMIVTYALSAGLKLASSLTVNFSWFIFKYDTTAEFIGFLVGSVVGQVLTFILNRKKTFNTTDYVAIRAVMYAILAVLIILMQTALGGAITSACYGAVPKEEASEFLKLVFNLTGQLVGGIAAVIVNFLGNKFLIMRDWSKVVAKIKGKGAKTSSDKTDAED